jgi:wyosine [tRNA(Phe)-imidazoG37] synthetase (radical SAM superfamily)
MVFADARGHLIDHPRLELVAFDGQTVRPPEPDELVPVPEGSDLFLLPGRVPLGRDPRSGAIQPFSELRGESVSAAAAFVAPAWLRLLHPAYRTGARAPELPLYAYAPLGYADDRFWTTAVRVDPERRQDPPLFDRAAIERGVARELAAHGDNRLYGHLRRCALEYGCRAAQNFFLHRWEAPLPTARTCNAACLGCLSSQPEGRCPATHDRIDFVPTPEEVAGVAVPHFRRVERAVASFGQGCEGEPLLNGALLEASVRRIRAETDRGTINLNTNASRPDTVVRLMAAGLDSLRVSFASATESLFDAFHRPRNYRLADVLDSCRAVKDAGGFLSLNLFVFPGVTDTAREVDALAPLVADLGVDLVQLRNLNVDPQLWLRTARAAVGAEAPVGLLRFMERLREARPALRYGYFNPYVGDRGGGPRGGHTGDVHTGDVRTGDVRTGDGHTGDGQGADSP